MDDLQEMEGRLTQLLCEEKAVSQLTICTFDMW